MAAGRVASVVSRVKELKDSVPGALRRGRRWLAGKYREVPLQAAGLRRRFSGGGSAGVRPENIVWIFGSGRSGSTWLRSMMGEPGRHLVWEEPMVGQLFGNFHRRAQKANLLRPDFVMADATRRGWIHSIRNFVLDGAKYARPRLGPDHLLVVKEPNGSVGAPLLMEALPESRMILLIRDPRDVVSSTLDGARKGNWLYERKDEGGWKRDSLPDKNPDAFTRRWANVYMQHAGNAKKAFDAHKGPKVMVRYEDLRADTLGTMRRIYSTLGIPVDEDELVRAVEKHSWENIPEKKKGGGKFYRKASPGGWREDLTAKQIKQVERITASLLEEYYSSGAP
jgi:hypothetical protein